MKNCVFRQIAWLWAVFTFCPLVSFSQWSSADRVLLQNINANLDDYWDNWDILEDNTRSIRNLNNTIALNSSALTNLTGQIKQDTDSLRDIVESIDDVVETFSDTSSIVQNMSYDVGGLTVTTYDIKDINDDIRTTTASILDALSNLEMPEIDLGELTIVMEGMVECCGNVASNTHDIVDVKMELEELVEKIDIFLEKVDDILDSLTDVATETTLEAFRNESHDDLIAISNTIAQFATVLYPATTRTGALDTTALDRYKGEFEAVALTPSMNDSEGVFEQQLDAIDLETDIANTNALQSGYTDVLEDYVRDDDRTLGLGNSLFDNLDTVEDKVYEALDFIDQIPTQDKLYLHPEFKNQYLKDQMPTIEIDFTISDDAQDLFDLFWSCFGYLIKVLAICYTSYLILNKVLSEWSTNPLGL